MKATSVLHEIRCIGLSVLVFLAGCAPQQQGASGQQVDEAEMTVVIEGIWKEYSASLEAGDLDRWLSLWTEDGIMMPPDEPAVVGKERIRIRIQGFLDRFTVGDQEITNQEVRAAGDWAYARGVYTETLTPKQGGDPIPGDGKYMTIFRRQSADGSWRVDRLIFNSNVAPGG